MSADQDREIEELFDSVMDLSAEEREASLAAHESASPQVVAKVRAMFHALDGDRKIAPQPRRPAVAAIPATGERIGPYLLTEEIGEGGFGVVYRASRMVGEQSADVAIKFLKITSHDPELEKRFALERQVLAELSHPAIARLIDGGTTAQGVPYLVMEFVQGEPITAYCNHRRLNISRRLELFVQACAAVEYAHRRQFLHRDLKPENIFVTSEGYVKLLDFGIIKMLAPDTRRALPVSMPGRHLFSLTHASPEQVAGSRLSVASDVYSLGVVLYELLCGNLPFAGRSLWDLEQARTRADRDPDAPSKVIDDQASSQYGLRPRHLERILRGDLDAITLTALRSSVESRYLSVESLRLDVQRFLAGLPVEARPPGRLERVSRWVRRDPLTFAALCFAFGLYLYGAHQTHLAAGRERQVEISHAGVMSANQHLLTALAGLMDGLGGQPGSDPAQELALQQQLQLLQIAGAFPTTLDQELAQIAAYPPTALCAWRLGHPQQAQQLLATSLAKLNGILLRHPQDTEATKMKAEVLCTRYRLLQSLGQLDLAEADHKQYQQLAAGGGPCRPI